MNIVFLTPGAAGMYCGACLRDAAIAKGLQKLGHNVRILPLYTPLKLDEPLEGLEDRIFFNGISVYLQDKVSLFRKTPAWTDRLFESQTLLKWASGLAPKTDPQQLGAMTLSMLQGEDGRQAKELDKLIQWMKQQEKPDVVCLSNSLLVGMAKKIKKELDVGIVCSFQGEDSFLNDLPEEYRDFSWATLTDQAVNVDVFVSPSRWYGELMERQLLLQPERLHIVPNGIDTDVFKPKAGAGGPPTIGYLARLCPLKGLDSLVEAFIHMKTIKEMKNIKLRAAGAMTSADEPFIKKMREKLSKYGLIGEVEFLPNISPEEKVSFLQSLSVLSVPALYGEAFGLYILEANACGVPVVQPRSGAFPELIETLGGGEIYETDDEDNLADALADLLYDKEQAQDLGIVGRQAVEERFGLEPAAKAFFQVCELAKELK